MIKGNVKTGGGMQTALIIGAVVLVIAVIIVVVVMATKSSCKIPKDKRLSAMNAVVGYYNWACTDGWWKTFSPKERAKVAFDEAAKGTGYPVADLVECWNKGGVKPTVKNSCSDSIPAVYEYA